MKYLFIGNRRFVLEELLKRSSDVAVYVMEKTHLHKENLLQQLPHKVIRTSEEVHRVLIDEEYDILISNGLPHILNLAKLPKKLFVNIHPSFLPDLRGVDPVLGSILFERDAGATCHIIDEGIDTGPIISQEKIPFSDDLHASLLYLLSFEAEKRCFISAWERNFIPIDQKQPTSTDTVYFTRSYNTKFLPLTGSDYEVIQTVKAFENKNQGARFLIDKQEFRCFDIWLSHNPFLLEMISQHEINSVAMVYEDTLIVKRNRSAIGLRHVEGNLDKNLVGKMIVGR